MAASQRSNAQSSTSSHWKDSEIYCKQKLEAFPSTKDPLYVYYWTSIYADVYAFGFDRNGDGKKFKANMKTSLYVFTADYSNLAPLMNLKYFDTGRSIREIKSEERFKIPPESLIHMLLKDCNTYTESGEDLPMMMYSIPTNSLRDAQSMHRLINGTAMKFHVFTVAVWSIELMVVLEMFFMGIPLKECIVYYTCLKPDLRRPVGREQFKPNIDMLTFDIETVSSFDNRVPLGEAKNDILFSASIIDHRKGELYSLVNLPFVDERAKLDDEFTRMIRSKNAPETLENLNAIIQEHEDTDGENNDDPNNDGLDNGDFNNRDNNGDFNNDNFNNSDRDHNNTGNLNNEDPNTRNLNNEDPNTRNLNNEDPNTRNLNNGDLNHENIIIPKRERSEDSKNEDSLLPAAKRAKKDSDETTTTMMITEDAEDWSQDTFCDSQEPPMNTTLDRNTEPINKKTTHLGEYEKYLIVPPLKKRRQIASIEPPSPEESRELERLRKLIDRPFEKTAHLKRTIVVVRDEEDLLREILKILDRSRPYYLVSYNSKAYDMMYLLKRAAYLCMPEVKNFWLDSGMPVYGKRMIHLDLMRIFRQMYTDVSNHSLDNMAKYCIGADAGKVNFSAKNLRYLYRTMLTDGVPEDGRFEDFDIDLATVIHYNDVDTLLLCQLWSTLNYDTFLAHLYQEHLISPIRHTQCKIGEFINNKAVYRSLLNSKVLTLHKSVSNKLTASNGRVSYSYNPNLLSAGVNENSFGGGFNMRAERNVFFNVLVNDVVAYYPKLQEGFNLSYETVSIVSVKTLALLCQEFDPTIPLKIFHFTVHKESKDEIVNFKKSRDLLNEQENNCAEVSSIEECIKTLQPTDRVMLIYDRENDQNETRRNDKSLLYNLISQQNRLRDYTKLFRKKLKVSIKQIKALLKGEKFKLEAAKKSEITKDLIAFYANDEQLEILSLDFAQADPIPVKELLDKVDSGDRTPVEEYLFKLQGAASRIESLYRSLKLENCSYYGLLGSNYGALIGRTVAAITTALGRKFIIDMARWSQRKGFDAILIDTDSVFVHGGDAANALQKGTPEMNRYIESNPLSTFTRTMINNKIVMTTNVYDFMLVAAKKVYIADHDRHYLSRGINKNGPTVWDEIVFSLADKYLASRSVHIESSDLLHILEEEVYMFIVEKMKTDKSVVLCTMSPNMSRIEMANTPIAKMWRRTMALEPEHVFDRKIKYFHVLHNKPTDVRFEPDHKLEITHYSKFNLFKFVSKINNAIYQILSKAIGITNFERHGLYATITMAEFNADSLKAFVNVNCRLRYWGSHVQFGNDASTSSL